MRSSGLWTVSCFTPRPGLGDPSTIGAVGQWARGAREKAASDGWWLVRRAQVLLASQDDCFPEIVMRHALDLQEIVQFRNLVREHPLRFVSLWGKWVKSIRKPVVQVRERRDFLLGDVL